MIAAARHRDVLNHPQRLRLLGSIDLDNPALHAELDTVAARIATLTAMPVGIASLVLDNAQYAAGSFGLTGWAADAGGVPIEWAFCTTVAATGRPYIITDTTAHPDASTNPLVTIGGLRSYAGVPLNIDGHTIGAACVLGITPRDFTDHDLTTLHTAASDITQIIARYED